MMRVFWRAEILPSQVFRAGRAEFPETPFERLARPRSDARTPDRRGVSALSLGMGPGEAELGGRPRRFG
jgi:hypothetical protein